MLKGSLASLIRRIPPALAPTQGLTIEVDGFTDLGGGEREALADASGEGDSG